MFRICGSGICKVMWCEASKTKQQFSLKMFATVVPCLICRNEKRRKSCALICKKLMLLLIFSKTWWKYSTTSSLGPRFPSTLTHEPQWQNSPVKPAVIRTEALLYSFPSQRRSSTSGVKHKTVVIIPYGLTITAGHMEKWCSAHAVIIARVPLVSLCWWSLKSACRLSIYGFFKYSLKSVTVSCRGRSAAVEMFTGAVPVTVQSPPPPHPGDAATGPEGLTEIELR